MTSSFQKGAWASRPHPHSGRDAHANAIFGVFAGTAALSAVLVLLIRPRKEFPAQDLSK